MLSLTGVYGCAEAQLAESQALLKKQKADESSHELERSRQLRELDELLTREKVRACLLPEAMSDCKCFVFVTVTETEASISAEAAPSNNRATEAASGGKLGEADCH